MQLADRSAIKRELAAWGAYYAALWALRDATGETWPVGW